MKKKTEADRGAVIVEATIVFPVCCIVILMLLYLGNVYYQKSRIEAIVTEAALDGAAYCADPLLRAIETGEGNKVPSLGEVSYEPYRYLGGWLGGMRGMEESVYAQITNRLRGLNTGLFAGMKPTGYDTGGLRVKYNNGFIASSVSVDLEYKIELPIRLLGERENLSIRFQTHTEVPVGDTPEFIRNVNLVEDVLEETGAMEQIKDKIKELESFVGRLFRK